MGTGDVLIKRVVDHLADGQIRTGGGKLALAMEQTYGLTRGRRT